MRYKGKNCLLVRDKVPRKLKDDGFKIDAIKPVYVGNKDECESDINVREIKELAYGNKLLQESADLVSTFDIEYFVDTLQLLMDMAKLENINWEEVESIRKEELESDGNYSECWFLIEATKNEEKS